MANRREVAAALAWGGLAAVMPATPARAQTWPDKPVRVISPYTAGSAADAVMRQLGEKLSRMWGQSVIVDPRPGGNNWIALDAVKRAAPDGYTLLLVDAIPFAVQPHIFKKLPFDPVKDFEPVAPVYWAHFFYVVAADSRWTGMGDLIAAAKANPGQVSYGSWAVGSQAHMAGAVIEAAANVRMNHVPFKDPVAIYSAVASGDITWALGSAGTAGALQRAKKVKFLAIAAPTRHPSYPDVPTVTEAGGTPAMEIKTWISLFAPAGTSRPVKDRINADVAKALAEPDIRERLFAVGFEPWTATGAEVAKTLQDDSRRFGQVLKGLNISLD